MLEGWLILSTLVCAIYLYLQGRYWLAWEQIPESEPKPKVYFPFVSILIPARNEAESIAECLRSIAAQNYPQDLFEILLIDDHSDDATSAIAGKLQIGNLRILSNPLEAGKKNALTHGFAEAKGDWILCTDADCRFSPDWISSMIQAGLNDNIHAIVGPIRIANTTNPFQYFQCLDIAGMSMITAAAIKNQWFRMANGANLGIRRNAFLELNGYRGIDQVASGDDVLLVQKIEAAHPGSVVYLKAVEAIVNTKSAVTWGSFLRQRIRWGSKYEHYPEQSINAFLALPFLFHWVLLLQGIGSFIYPVLGYHFIFLLLAKILIDLVFLRSGFAFFQIPVRNGQYLKAIWYQYWYILIAGTASVLRLNVKWK